MWLLFAFGSALFAGMTAILAKIGIKNTDSSLATAIRTVVILLFSWLIVLIAGTESDLKTIKPETLLFLILSGLATGASWLFYFKALQLGDVNKVTPVDKSSTILAIIFAFVFLGEPVTLPKIAGISAIAAGTFLMIAKKHPAKTAEKNYQWLLYAGLSAIFAALTAILGKIGIQNINSSLGTAIRTIVVLIMAWIVVLARKKQQNIKEVDRKSLAFILFSGITTGLSWLCYFKALQDGQVCIVVPVDKLSIVCTILFSYIFLKEKLSKNALIGSAILVAGTLLLLL